MAEHKVNFKDKKTSDGTLIYYASFKHSFNKDLNEIQVYLDNLVAKNLKPYVSKKTGTQENLTQSYEQGSVTINVPYAEYQAYSKRIKKRVGKRGTQPFERMKSDKKDAILRQVQAYARRLNG